MSSFSKGDDWLGLRKNGRLHSPALPVWSGCGLSLQPGLSIEILAESWWSASACVRGLTGNCSLYGRHPLPRIWKHRWAQLLLWGGQWWPTKTWVAYSVTHGLETKNCCWLYPPVENCAVLYFQGRERKGSGKRATGVDAGCAYQGCFYAACISEPRLISGEFPRPSHGRKTKDTNLALCY